MPSTRESDPAVESIRAIIAGLEARLVKYRRALALLEEASDEQISLIAHDDRTARAVPRLIGRSHPLRVSGETMVGLAERVLSAAERPMHIMELTAGVIEAGYPNKNMKAVKASLVRTIDRKAEKGRTFVRVAPATYALKAWGGPN
jgi:hypothetical protein